MKKNKKILETKKREKFYFLLLTFFIYNRKNTKVYSGKEDKTFTPASLNLLKISNSLIIFCSEHK